MQLRIQAGMRLANRLLQIERMEDMVEQLRERYDREVAEAEADVEVRLQNLLEMTDEPAGEGHSSYDPRMIEVGKKAPAFHLADGDGEKHRLSSYADGYVVLYFYPKDDTSGCTKEACAFEICTPNFRAWMRWFLG